MKIIPYRNLPCKNDLLPLMDHAFGWPFNPRRFDQFLAVDPRLKFSSAGFCAVEDEHVVGFVGVMDMATKNVKSDLEHVGGIYGVATLPGYTRRGICSALMEHAHQYFSEKGYRFSLLTTSHSLVAHALYEKLGYVDLFERKTAYKNLEKRKRKVSKSKTSKLDFDKMLKIYDSYVQDKTGFVVRNENYLKMLKKAGDLAAKNCLATDKGYVVFREERGGIWIRELIALDNVEMDKLVNEVEEKAKDLVFDRTIFDEALLKIYKRRGYVIHGRSHGVIMMKPLVDNVSFKQTYGDKFYISNLDLF